MFTLTTRRAVEVAALRASARSAMGQSAYRTAVAEATVATLDWVEGLRELAPASERLMVADQAGLAREALLAADLENAAVRGGEDHVWPGAVWQTVEWFRCSHGVEAPIL